MLAFKFHHGGPGPRSQQVVVFAEWKISAQREESRLFYSVRSREMITISCHQSAAHVQDAAFGLCPRGLDYRPVSCGVLRAIPPCASSELVSLRTAYTSPILRDPRTCESSQDHNTHFRKFLLDQPAGIGIGTFWQHRNRDVLNLSSTPPVALPTPISTLRIVGWQTEYEGER
jgi:hypothetical protein